MRSELLSQSSGDSTQDLLRELIDISNKSFEKMNILADIAQLQVEEAKKLAFQLREMAIEAARGRSDSSASSAAADPEALAEEEKKGLFGDLPFMIFGAGGFRGFLARFFKGLALTALFAGVAYALGDDLNNYVTDLTGNEDMGSLAEYILYGSAAAPLITSMLAGTKFGGRFGGLKGLLIGAIVGLTVGLTDIVGDKVKEATGSSILKEASKILAGTLGGAAAGFIAFGPPGAIIGAIAGAALTAAAAIYNYFKDDSETKRAIDAEFEKLEDTMNQASQWMINWVRNNLSDTVRKAIGI